MKVLSKSSIDARSFLIRPIRAPCIIFFVAAVVATSHFLLGQTPLCAFHTGIIRHPNMPTRRTCLDGTSAVDHEGHPCISLKNFTKLTSIHRTKTPETTYMYCSIPKNGCSYHIDLLHRVSGDNYPGSAKHYLANKAKIMINDEKEAAQLLANASVPKYMVIRNPLTRVLSGYLCKVEKYIPEIERTPASYQRWVREQFSRLKSWKGVNPHWIAQTEYCGYGMRDIQKKFHVFRVEKPVEYVDFLYSIIPSHVLETGWGENKSSYRDFVLSPHKRTGHTEDLFYDYVGNLKTFDLLERTYRKDIDTLGYRDQVTQMRKELAEITGQTEDSSQVNGTAKKGFASAGQS